MSPLTAGIDVGSTYTKTVLADRGGSVVARDLRKTGFRLQEAATEGLEAALAVAGVARDDVDYVVATGFGRHQVGFKDLAVTDLTAGARGACRLFPGTRTVLDVGGQTMKAVKVDESRFVRSFRLNDKCAAGTGAFLEKTARYMGYETEEIGALLLSSKEPVAVSGVCAVFAESEVINHLSQGAPPAEIMQGAIESLTGRAVQLMKRIKGGPEFTLVGGIMRFPTMPRAVVRHLGEEVNVPEGEAVQFVAAEGAAHLGHLRLERAALATA